MKRTIIIYGLIAGAVVSAFMATTMFSTNNNKTIHAGMLSMVIGYLSMLIAFTFIFVAIKSYRDKQNNSIINFGKAFGMGLLISLIASTMYVITWAIIYKNLLPNYMERYSIAMIEQAKTSLSGAALQAKVDEINKGKEVYEIPLGFTIYTYAEILPVGILVSLIAALVLKKK